MRLLDKVAIITGGGRGIGRGIARLFAREGARIVIAARSEEELSSTVSMIGSQGGIARSVVTDVSRSTDIERMVRFAVEEFGTINVLVNNAGIGGFGFAIDHPEMEQAYDRLLATNLKSVWMASHFAVPHMKKAGGGSIINIASVHAWNTTPGNSAYAATKGAMVAGTRGLAVELAPFLIRVNAISPGSIHLRDTEDWIGEKFGEEARAEFLERFAKVTLAQRQAQQPLPVAGTPEDIAWCALYLASEESRFVTGTNITVDGGMTAILNGSVPLGPEEQRKLRDLSAWIESLSKQR